MIFSIFQIKNVFCTSLSKKGISRIHRVSLLLRNCKNVYHFSSYEYLEFVSSPITLKLTYEFVSPSATLQPHFTRESILFQAFPKRKKKKKSSHCSAPRDYWGDATYTPTLGNLISLARQTPGGSSLCEPGLFRQPEMQITRALV